jgi:hypothetical protein
VNIVRLCGQRNWSQEMLALEAGLHRTFIAHVERSAEHLDRQSRKNRSSAGSCPASASFARLRKYFSQAIHRHGGTKLARDLTPCFLKKLPAYAALVGPTPKLPWPGMLFVRVVPTSLMVLDYTKRFGHTTRCAVTGLA